MRNLLQAVERSNQKFCTPAPIHVYGLATPLASQTMNKHIIVNTQIKSSKKSYYTNKLNETYGHPHKKWQVIKELTSRKSYKPSIREIQLNSVSITKPVDM